MTTPLIHPNTAAAMAQDPYLSIPALDDDMWQGASDDARAFTWEEWAMCHSGQPDDGGMERISAMNADGECAVAYHDGYRWGAWEAA